MIKGDRLCFHIKGLCSGSFNDSEINSFIGRLLSVKDERTYVERCKQLKQMLLRRLEGKNLLPRDYPLWRFVPYKNKKRPLGITVDVDRYYGDWIPADPFIRMVLELDPRPARNTKIFAGLMNLKSAVWNDRVSLSDRDKHFQSITSPFRGDPEALKALEPEIRAVTRYLIRGISPVLEEDDFLPLGAMPITGKSRVGVTSDGDVKSVSDEHLLAYNISYIMQTKELYWLYKVDPARFCSYVFFGRMQNREIDPQYFKDLKESVCLNIIQVIMSLPGLKERGIAKPQQLMQAASYPLMRLLFRIIERSEVQGVMDHDECARSISRQLALYDSIGKPVINHSIDLSSYTDRMPYKGMQEVILDEMVNQSYISPFDKAVQDTIVGCKCDFYGRIVTYSAGTPMGTFPSFPLASIANEVVARIAYKHAHARWATRNVCPAKVIGDDFSTLDELLANEYRHLMTDVLGVSIAENKGLVSPYFVEMCSKIISKEGVFEEKRVITSSIQKDLVGREKTSPLSLFIEDLLYYGEEYVADHYQNGKTAIELLKCIPKPYGLGTEITDLLQADVSELPPIEAISLARFAASRFVSIIPTVMSRRDYDIIQKRKQLYPPFIGEDTTVVVSNSKRQLPPVVESIAKEIPRLVRRLGSEQLDKKLVAAHQITGLYKFCEEILGEQSLLNRDHTPLDHHFAEIEQRATRLASSELYSLARHLRQPTR